MPLELFAPPPYLLIVVRQWSYAGSRPDFHRIAERREWQFRLVHRFTSRKTSTPLAPAIQETGDGGSDQAP